MRDNDIIKALECCVSGDYTTSQVEVCKPCPYFHDGNCTDLLKRNALDLINRQKAEIEVLQNDVSFLDKYNDELLEDNDELLEDNDKLKEEIDNLKAVLNSLREDDDVD